MNGAGQEHRTASADLYHLWETSGENDQSSGHKRETQQLFPPSEWT